MRVLVTGGAGFIGSHLVDALLEQGHDVVVLDNFSSGKKDNLAHVADKIQIIEGDIRDFETVNKACQNVNIVFHEAAVASVPRSLEEPQLFIDVNITGMHNVLEASRKAGVKRVIFASSSSVYGDNQNMPLKETETGTRLSPYAISKYTGEDLCKFFWKQYGMETVILRYFNVFGPRQDPESPYAAVVPIFLRHMTQDESPSIFGDGEQKRDFTYISNVVHANMLAITAENAPGEAINIANMKGTTVNGIFAQLNKILGKELAPNHTDPRPGDIRDSSGNNVKAKELLNYAPVTGVEKGLRSTVNWFLEEWKKSAS